MINFVVDFHLQILIFTFSSVRSCSLCCNSYGALPHISMSSATQRWLGCSPSLKKLLISQVSVRNMFHSVAANGDMVSPCRAPTLILILLV